MDVPHLLTFSILSLWLLLNLLFVFFSKKVGSYVYRFDPFGWISSYTLFSNTPRSFRMYYRNQLIGGSYSNWNAIEFSGYSRYSVFWQPTSLVNSTVISAIDDLAKYAENHQHDSAMKNISNRFFYKTVQKYVNSIPADKDIISRQFRVNEAKGITGNYIEYSLFTSEFSAV